ncbi:MAG: hypothetical protein QNI84_16830 [Henriciella sp.]|nr:hypothetical protein [Henriciella sp.]
MTWLRIGILACGLAGIVACGTTPGGQACMYQPDGACLPYGEASEAEPNYIDPEGIWTYTFTSEPLSGYTYERGDTVRFELERTLSRTMIGWFTTPEHPLRYEGNNVWVHAHSGSMFEFDSDYSGYYWQNDGTGEEGPITRIR